MKNQPSLILKVALAIVVCESIGITAGLFTAESVSTWFRTLEKPFFNPPSWLFAPVWIILYLLMGVSAGIIWSKGLGRADVRKSLTIFGVQLVLNFLWSFLFFKLQNPLLGLLDIIPLFLLIVFLIVSFYRIDKVSGLLLIPYLLWVGFATVLNFAIWWLN